MTDKKRKFIPKEIWVNCLVAGGLVFFGAFAVSTFEWKMVLLAIATSAVAFLTRLKAYLDTRQRKEPSHQVFNFVGGLAI